MQTCDKLADGRDQCKLLDVSSFFLSFFSDDDDEELIIANREFPGVDWAAPYMGQWRGQQIAPICI